MTIIPNYKKEQSFRSLLQTCLSKVPLISGANYECILNKMETLTEIRAEINHVEVETLFRVGETFGNYEVEKKLKDFEKASFSQFWKRDARTVATTMKRLDRPLNPALK